MSEKQPRPSERRLAGRIAGLRPSLYSKLLLRLERFEGEVFPFHIGESHAPPDEVIRQALVTSSVDPSIHRYGHPQGIAPLRDAIAQRLTAHGYGSVDKDHVIVTHGATHGLNLACQAILDPGDVMLVLSPHWPLINAMVHTASAVPIEVPFTNAVRLSGLRPSQILEAHDMLRVRALYLTSPNNPDGVVLDDSELREVADFCVSRDLFVIVDEAYDAFHFGARPTRLSTLPGMAERTINVFTLSKSHRMTGLRVGYTVGPPEVIDAMTKLANISVYNVSLLSQRAALAALLAGDAPVTRTVEIAASSARQFSRALAELPAVRFQAPAGGAYVFADLTEILKGRATHRLLDAAVDRGILFAPGIGFGSSFEPWARFCFTAMEHDKLARGTTELVTLLDEFQRDG